MVVSSLLVRCRKCHRPYARVADCCPECHAPSPTEHRILFVKIGSIVGAAAALTVAVSLARKIPVAKESRQTVTRLAPLADGEVRFSQ